MSSEYVLWFLLWANIVAHAIVFVGLIWSIASPGRRVYPMRRRGPVFWLMWFLFGYIFASNAALVLLDWNTGPWVGHMRLFLGVPIAGLGAAFVTWGIVTLGIKNTSAVRDGLITAGPYLISRNPQYVGDFFLFLGIAIIANSEVVWVSHLLTGLVLLLAPLAEEPWLEVEYGERYAAYRRQAPRYL